MFPITVPPLRERRKDIVPLTKHLLDVICTSMGKEVLTITRQQGEWLQSLTWPGNIRELRNVLERAVILTKGSRLRLDLALPNHDRLTEDNKTSDSSNPENDKGFLTEAEFQLREKQNLVAALAHANWRVSGDGGAADLLGIKPSTLTYRMKALGIEKPTAS